MIPFSNGSTPVSPVRSSDETPKLTVEVINNHIYFYADVDTDRCLALVRNIRVIDEQLRNERASRMVPKDHPSVPIWLHIQSGGGSLHAGLATADQFSTIATPIYSLVEGYAASAATIISVACTKRFILPSAYMMIHEFSSVMWGKYRDFQDEMKLYDMLMIQMVNFYAKRTKISKAKVRKLLDHDSWFNAEQCVEIGLVDEILV